MTIEESSHLASLGWDASWMAAFAAALTPSGTRDAEPLHTGARHRRASRAIRRRRPRWRTIRGARRTVSACCDHARRTAGRRRLGWRLAEQWGRNRNRPLRRASVAAPSCARQPATRRRAGRRRERRCRAHRDRVAGGSEHPATRAVPNAGVGERGNADRRAHEVRSVRRHRRSGGSTPVLAAPGVDVVAVSSGHAATASTSSSSHLDPGSNGSAPRLVGRGEVDAREPAARHGAAANRGGSRRRAREAHDHTSRARCVLGNGASARSTRPGCASCSSGTPTRGSARPLRTSTRWPSSAAFAIAQHAEEPGCAVHEAIDRGDLAPSGSTIGTISGASWRISSVSRTIARRPRRGHR